MTSRRRCCCVGPGPGCPAYAPSGCLSSICSPTDPALELIKLPPFNEGPDAGRVPVHFVGAVRVYANSTRTGSIPHDVSAFVEFPLLANGDPALDCVSVGFGGNGSAVRPCLPGAAGPCTINPSLGGAFGSEPVSPPDSPHFFMNFGASIAFGNDPLPGISGINFQWINDDPPVVNFGIAGSAPDWTGFFTFDVTDYEPGNATAVVVINGERTTGGGSFDLITVRYRIEMRIAVGVFVWCDGAHVTVCPPELPGEWEEEPEWFDDSDPDPEPGECPPGCVKGPLGWSNFITDPLSPEAGCNPPTREEHEAAGLTWGCGTLETVTCPGTLVQLCAFVPCGAAGTANNTLLALCGQLFPIGTDGGESQAEQAMGNNAIAPEVVARIETQSRLGGCRGCGDGFSG